MSDYAPKPLRPEAENPLITIGDTYTITKSHRTPIQRQRDLDGTPHTVTSRTCLGPKGEVLYLGDEHITKSQGNSDVVKATPDPDEVMKSYLARG